MSNPFHPIRRFGNVVVNAVGTPEAAGGGVRPEVSNACRQLLDIVVGNEESAASTAATTTTTNTAVASERMPTASDSNNNNQKKNEIVIDLLGLFPPLKPIEIYELSSAFTKANRKQRQYQQRRPRSNSTISTTTDSGGDATTTTATTNAPGAASSSQQQQQQPSTAAAFGSTADNIVIVKLILSKCLPNESGARLVRSLSSPTSLSMLHSLFETLLTLTPPPPVSMIKEYGSGTVAAPAPFFLLEELKLGSNGLDDTHARFIGHALKTNRTLKTLWLHENHFTGAGIQSIVDGLTHNGGYHTALEELNLSWNAIGIDGCYALASLLACTPLSSTSFGLDAAAAATTTTAATTLATIGTRDGNDVHDEDDDEDDDDDHQHPRDTSMVHKRHRRDEDHPYHHEPVRPRHRCSIKVLLLEMCLQQDQQTAVPTARAAGEQHAVDYSPSCTEILCEGLARNASLEKLSLRCNFLNDVDCIDLATHALRQNGTLRELTLSLNSIQNDHGVVMEALEDTLRTTNYAVEAIDLTHNPHISIVERNRITALCQNNIRLKQIMKSRIPIITTTARQRRQSELLFLHNQEQRTLAAHDTVAALSFASPSSMSMPTDAASAGADVATATPTIKFTHKGLWPYVLNVVASKPDYILEVLRKNMNEIFLRH